MPLASCLLPLASCLLPLASCPSLNDFVHNSNYIVYYVTFYCLSRTTRNLYRSRCHSLC
ncbi:hypothetical protein [Moorena producens]|uniref:hypothetical protein n=1 Tax=Moorena producens TaxID=1155739 RepID=UPI001314303E|nr:hypothetical protein [Moorena producens]